MGDSKVIAHKKDQRFRWACPKCARIHGRLMITKTVYCDGCKTSYPNYEWVKHVVEEDSHTIERYFKRKARKRADKKADRTTVKTAPGAANPPGDSVEAPASGDIPAPETFDPQEVFDENDTDLSRGFDIKMPDSQPDKPEADFKCEKCGTALKQGWSSCPGCGTILDWSGV